MRHLNCLWWVTIALLMSSGIVVYYRVQEAYGDHLSWLLPFAWILTTALAVTAGLLFAGYRAARLDVSKTRYASAVILGTTTFVFSSPPFWVSYIPFFLLPALYLFVVVTLLLSVFWIVGKGKRPDNNVQWGQ